MSIVWDVRVVCDRCESSFRTHTTTSPGPKAKAEARRLAAFAGVRRKGVRDLCHPCQKIELEGAKP